MPGQPALRNVSDGGPTVKKRILFLRKTVSFGGSEVVMMELLKAIDYRKNDVILASTVDVFSNPVTNCQIPVTCLPLTAPFAGGFLGTFFSWVRFLSDREADKIIFAEGGFADFPLPAALAAFVVARGNVWLMALHPAPEPRKNQGLRWGFLPRMHLTDRTRAWLMRGILAVSKGVKDRLVQGYRYPADKITVVYNGVDANHFSPASPDLRKQLRGDLQIPEEAVVMVSAARLDKVKRLERLINAFSVLSLTNKNLWLILTGDGPLREELETLARSANSHERIRFLGYVEDVRSILHASDLYALPSDEEGFGIALVEAMACKLLCVSTKTVGPIEIIQDGRNGFLTDLSYEGVLEGLRRALQLKEEQRQMIAHLARQTVVDNFSVEKSVKNGLTLLEIDQAQGTAQ
jgi:glycosyltransferase involved in cell wall biosynthesis